MNYRLGEIVMLSYKKPIFWIILLAIAIIAVGARLLSNPELDEIQADIPQVSDDKTVEDFAWEFIEKEIDMYEDPDGGWQGFKIVDSKITKLEKMETFEGILSSPIEIWALEYRLKPDDISKVAIAGGMQEIDGWITEDTSMGKPILAFLLEDDGKEFLGSFYPQESGIESLALQEMAIRIMLESKGLLANESYPGNHAVIEFKLSTGENSQLLLSQPVVQGEKGIWAVERWMDGNGNIYYEHPKTEIKINDHYKELQKQFENGENLSLGDPLELGYNFIKENLGQRFTKKQDLKIKKPATVEDFMNTPISYYIGYILNISLERTQIDIDRVEFLRIEDIERLDELDINPQIEMPSGIYIYNPETQSYPLDLSEKTKYKLLNWEDISKHKMVTKEVFIDYLEELDYDPLFNVFTRDGYIDSIEEQYLP